MSASHDTYVYPSERRWHWRCPCGARAGGFRRRMDADVSAEDHQDPSLPASLTITGSPE